MTSLWPEIRGAVRLARRQPLFTSLLVVVLTLGIGSSVAVFGVLNAVVLRPLPYATPQQLVWLESVRPDGTRGPFSIQDFVDLRERETRCASVGAFANRSANLSGVAFTPSARTPWPQGRGSSASVRRSGRRREGSSRWCSGRTSRPS